VRLNGQDIDLGPYDRTEAQSKYETLIAEWLANGQRLPEARRSVGELVLAYIELANNAQIKSSYSLSCGVIRGSFYNFSSRFHNG
jgi:hypothetical protein